MDEGEFKVFCIRKDGSSGINGASNTMFEAFSSVKDEGFIPHWLFESDCFKVQKKEKNSAYLFDHFKGEGFNHIQSLRCRIFGPQCILSSLQHKMDIPRRSTPILNLAMKDLIVCCSNLKKETRDDLHEKIELMGGEASKTLTDQVTHLVAGEVGSKKYQVSGELGKQIMLPEWVEAVWKKSLEGHIHGSDGQFAEYSCPIFYGLVITVSGFDSQERQEMKKIVEAEGGKYTGEMKVKECTHLIINKPKGQKHEFAKKWKMHIIKSDWLYDSVEKGYCLEENKYCLEGSKDSDVKTSTPEKGPAKNRVSSIADISSISNISMIGGHVVNETASTTRADYTTFNETQPPKADAIESSIQAIDLTRPPSDYFLDGCKIYLSGFRGQALEKMRKVINAGGATRLNQLNEAVTHVIIGEKIDKDINQLMAAVYRPKVVSPAWLAECYRNGRTVDETPFSCLDLPTIESESPKLKRKSTKHEKQESVQNKTIEPEVAKPEADNEQDEIDIMSQYLMQPVSEPVEEVAQNNTIQEPAPTDAAPIIQNKAGEEEDHDATQNPELDSQGQKKVLIGKSFMFFGFVEEQITELVDFVQNEGGKVYQGNARLVPDYGIVPIDGFPVDKTVSEIATSTWLQMCVEYEKILPVSSNPLFSPVDINIENNPLADCLLSFSGWSGAEKDCLIHIAECAGAGTQEYFVRNAKKGLLPTTHLITKEASGQKYTAAKKWGIPALSKMWILSCAKSGKREPEEKYFIDNEGSMSFNAGNSNDQTTTSAQGLNKSQVGESADDGENKVQASTSKMNSNNQKESTAQYESPSINIAESSKQTPQQKSNTSVGMETMAAMEGFGSEMTIDTDLPADKSKENLREEADMNTSQKNSQKPFQESQKENVKHEQTPVQSKVVNNRVKALQNDEFESTPKNSSRKLSVNSPSPGRFLDPTKEFKPRFELTDVMKLLQTPPAEKARNARKRESLPLDELFSEKLQKAIEITDKPRENLGDEVDGHAGAESTNDTGFGPLSQHVGPLTGVVIAVSKKLPNQGEYNDTVSALGGDYRWTYDKSCTHFIYQSNRANDTAKEFRTAREQKKIIVSPHWLFMCKEQNAWVDESLFPHNYNPNLTLSVSRKKGTPARTPARSTRKATRGNPHVDSASDLQPSTLNFDKEVDRVTNNKVKNMKDSDKEVVSESDTDNEIRSRLGQGQSDAKTEIKSRLGQTKADDGPRGGKKARQSSKNDEDKTSEPGQPAAGSMEMREVLSKELENVMLSEKSKKSASRRRSKRLNCSGNMSGDLSCSNDKINSSRQNRWSLQDESKGEKKTPSSSDKSVENNSAPEPSQSVQVTWDDHTGRMEQQKLAHKLERACSPTQDVAEFLDGEFSEEEEDIDYDAMEIADPEQPQHEVEERVPTPEGPSLAFHKTSSKAKNKISSPEPVHIEDEEEAAIVEKPPPVFIMSGLSQPEKDDYGALVEQLGGKVLESLRFECSCTHLVIGNPTRNEKFLASVASGKWVLHKSFFEACRQEGKFVQEDFYEWGGDGTKSLISNPMTLNLATAAHKWRVKVQSALQSSNHCPGAFDGWIVLLNCDKNKDDNFKRLLEAGGATVLPNKPPYEENIRATHAFVDLNKKPLGQPDIQNLINNKIMCLKPEYIAAHLTDNPSPNPEDYLPSEVSTILSISTSSERSKRKAPSSITSTSDSESNRSKRTRRR